MEIDSFKLSYSDDSGTHELVFSKNETAQPKDCVTIGGTSYAVLSPEKDIASAKQILGALQVHGPFSSLVEVKHDLYQKGIKNLTTSAQLETPTIKKIVSVLGQKFEKEYISSSMGKVCKEKLQENLEKGMYNSILDPAVLAQVLTADLRTITNDKHVKVFVWEGKEPKLVSTAVVPQAPNSTPQATPEPHLAGLNQLKECHAAFQKEQYGIQAARILEGTATGYVDLRCFPRNDTIPEDVLDGKEGGLPASREMKQAIRNEEAAIQRDIRAAFDKAMAAIHNAESIVIDLRHNEGGDPRIVEYLLSYFLEAGIPLNTIQYREKSAAEFTSLPEEVIPRNQRRLLTPLYVLTSESTFSGGEEFAYDLKNLGRATIIGNVTAGGANPCTLYNISDEEEMLAVISTGQARSPYTGTNWEGEGVIPDVMTDPASALDVALKMIREK